MKKHRFIKHRPYPPVIKDEPIDEVEAVSATEMTGLYPTPPEDRFEESSYEDVYPGKVN